MMRYKLPNLYKIYYHFARDHASLFAVLLTLKIGEIMPVADRVQTQLLNVG